MVEINQSEKRTCPLYVGSQTNFAPTKLFKNKFEIVAVFLSIFCECFY